MSDLAPDSPEYKEAYDKEMQRLEAAEAKPADKPADKPAETTSTDSPKVDDPKPETAEQLTARLASTEKALKDTQRAFHDNAARVKKLEREAEERRRAEGNARVQPLLDANPGLKEAIEHIAAPAEAPPRNRWQSDIQHAIPDIETLLADADFYKAAQARRDQLGDEWDNPLTAIREFSTLKSQHQSAQQSKAAVEAARLAFQQKADKRPGMEVPGGSGGKGASKEVDEAQQMRDMSDEDFRKMRARTLGYG